MMMTITNTISHSLLAEKNNSEDQPENVELKKTHTVLEPRAGSRVKLPDNTDSRIMLSSLGSASCRSPTTSSLGLVAVSSPADVGWQQDAGVHSIPINDTARSS